MVAHHNLEDLEGFDRIMLRLRSYDWREENPKNCEG